MVVDAVGVQVGLHAELLRHLVEQTLARQCGVDGREPVLLTAGEVVEDVLDVDAVALQVGLEVADNGLGGSQQRVERQA